MKVNNYNQAISTYPIRWAEKAEEETNCNDAIDTAAQELTSAPANALGEGSSATATTPSPHVKSLEQINPIEYILQGNPTSSRIIIIQNNNIFAVRHSISTLLNNYNIHCRLWFGAFTRS